MTRDKILERRQQIFEKIKQMKVGDIIYYPFYLYGKLFDVSELSLEQIVEDPIYKHVYVFLNDKKDIGLDKDRLEIAESDLLELSHSALDLIDINKDNIPKGRIEDEDNTGEDENENEDDKSINLKVKKIDGKVQLKLDVKGFSKGDVIAYLSIALDEAIKDVKQLIK